MILWFYDVMVFWFFNFYNNKYLKFRIVCFGILLLCLLCLFCYLFCLVLNLFFQIFDHSLYLKLFSPPFPPGKPFYFIYARWYIHLWNFKFSSTRHCVNCTLLPTFVEGSRQNSRRKQRPPTPSWCVFISFAERVTRAPHDAIWPRPPEDCTYACLQHFRRKIA